CNGGLLRRDDACCPRHQYPELRECDRNYQSDRCVDLGSQRDGGRTNLMRPEPEIRFQKNEATRGHQGRGDDASIEVRERLMNKMKKSRKREKPRRTNKPELEAI